MITNPSLAVEQELLETSEVVIGIDEVGRGAIAGPVAVGACAIGPQQLKSGFPQGLRDSKLLTALARERIAPQAKQWSLTSAVGWASASEIDKYGINACLAAAGVRALADLWQAGVEVERACVLLDGRHDWLSNALKSPLRVQVRVKADRDCASVSAASVIA